MVPDTVKQDIEDLKGEFAFQMDDSSTADTLYIGTAHMGSATSSAVWKVKKIDTSSGLAITWADGNALFDNVWDDRVSLSYI